MAPKKSKSSGTKAFSLSQDATSSRGNQSSSQTSRRDISPIRNDLNHTQVKSRKQFDLSSVAAPFEPRDIRFSSVPPSVSGVRHVSTKRTKTQNNELNNNNDFDNDEFVFTRSLSSVSSSQPIMTDTKFLGRQTQARRARSTVTLTHAPVSTTAKPRNTKRPRVEASPPPPPVLPSPIGSRTPHQHKYLSFEGETPVAIHRKRPPKTIPPATHSTTSRSPLKSLTAETVAESIGDTSFQFTVPLPVQDTPMIRRNQELRKQNTRRSSLGKRGKRASSIGNGLVAVPHNDINPRDYYKHLDPHLSDPQKMRNLMIWSGTKILEEEAKELHRRRDQLTTKAGRSNNNGNNIGNDGGDLTTEEDTARKIARVVKEELLRDLKEGKADISWWGRPEISTTNALSNPLTTSMTTSTAPPVIRQPNMQNLINQQRLEVYKAKLQALQDEGRQWDAIREKVLSTNIYPDGEKLLATVNSGDAEIEKYLDGTVKRENEALRAKVESGLSKVEYQIDTLLDTADRIKSIFEATDDFAERKLAKLANYVAERDRISRVNTLANTNTNPDIAPVDTQPLSTRDLMRLLSVTVARR